MNHNDPRTPGACVHARIDPSITCLDCGARLMEPGPIVSAPQACAHRLTSGADLMCDECGALLEPVRLRRRPAAEVAAYFDGALAALRMAKTRPVDDLIAMFETALTVRP